MLAFVCITLVCFLTFKFMICLGLLCLVNALVVYCCFACCELLFCYCLGMLLLNCCIKYYFVHCGDSIVCYVSFIFWLLLD